MKALYSHKVRVIFLSGYRIEPKGKMKEEALHRLCESFNGRLRDECLNAHQLESL